MDALPDQLIWDILRRITNTEDRNSVSLTCKRFHEVENEQRLNLRVGCGLYPANKALNILCNRFPNLIKVEIVYSGWMSKFGKQLDDQGLLALSSNCPCLVDLTLSYCTFITDAGISYLESCSKLSSLKLNFTPRITGCGILSVVVGCQKNQDLSIKNCRAIGEGDLVKLGFSWQNLKRLQFEVDANYRYMKLYDRMAIEKWQKQLVPCENMKELNLVNCIIRPGRGLACVLNKCKNLQKIQLDMCVGLRDNDIVGLAQNARGLRSISLRVPSDFSLPLLMSNRLTLTDESLKALSENCPKLESVRISFSDGEFPSLSSFTIDGILCLIRNCPVRELSLDHMCSFGDEGMEALCSASCLETLELVKCQEISDDGLQLVAQFLQLSVLRLVKCLGVSDDGFKPLVGSDKLDVLVVEDCPQVSETGVHRAAKTVSFKQDLSWMY
ncbi:F-box/LRR-repeat protein 14 [Bienertia sinuspersici]